MNSQKYSEMTCEQVYNIWTTEPELISLFDLRAREEYEKGHVPGSVHTKISELTRALKRLGDKLAILIASDNQKVEILKECQSFDNFSLMKQCHRWNELKFPLSGNSVEQVRKKFIFHSKGESVNKDIIFHQLFEHESSTYTYIIADKMTKEAAIIDPVLETVDRDLKLIDELGLKLIYTLDTHIHADHVTGAAEIRKRLKIKTAVSAASGVQCADVLLEDGQELALGDKKIKVISTPGHTDTCLTFAFEGMIFTGDALLIRGCGRTDFQQGSSARLFQSVREKLFRLPDETIIYPGHDYRGQTSSTVGTEKKHNPRLNEKMSLDDFSKLMSELKLAYPKKIDQAVPANLVCGDLKDSRTLHPQVVDGIPEMTVEDLMNHMMDVKNKKIRLIDVRRPDEYNNELGHIDGTELVTLGLDLTQLLEKGNRSEEIVFVCRSGGRSGSATAESIKLGYKYTVNMVGGMLRWNEKKFPTIKN